MNAPRLYLRCLGASIRSQMQHRTSFFMLVLGQALVAGTEFAGVWMLFNRFGQLRGWTLPQVALLFGMANVSFALRKGSGGVSIRSARWSRAGISTGCSYARGVQRCRWPRKRFN